MVPEATLSQRIGLTDIEHLHAPAELSGEEIDGGFRRQLFQIETLVQARHRLLQRNRGMPRHRYSHSAIAPGAARRGDTSSDETFLAAFNLAASSSGSGA